MGPLYGDGHLTFVGRVQVPFFQDGIGGESILPERGL